MKNSSHTKRIPLVLSAASTLLLTLTACIHHETTIVRDVERVPVQFESEAAGRIFYQTLSQHRLDRRQRESKTHLSLPLVFDHEREVVTGPNQAFNEAVSRCDTNRDGLITETEAKIFAGD